MVRTTLGSLDITSVPGSQLRSRICTWRRSTVVKALGLRQRQRQELRITAHSLNPGISDLDVEGLERSTSPYSSFQSKEMKIREENRLAQGHMASWQNQVQTRFTIDGTKLFLWQLLRWSARTQPT